MYFLISPRYFYYFSAKLIPIIWLFFAFLFSYGLIASLWLAPLDYQQGDVYRIIYIHVPCAVMSLFIFMMMGIAASIYLIWHLKLADIIAKVSAPLGFNFTFLALLTGSIWGKPTWGTWWIWDARLTSELILLFLYAGVILLRSSIKNINAAGKATAILTLVGLVDIPIIHYSVNWWNTLHQKASLLQLAKPTLAPAMLYPLLAMLISVFLYFIAIMLMQVRGEILIQEQKTNWVKKILIREKKHAS